jgi:hypothetical protein
MWRAVELPDVHHIALILQDGRLVVVDIQIVRSTEDSHDRWETGRFRLPIHPIPTHKGQREIPTSNFYITRHLVLRVRE